MGTTKITINLVEQSCDIEVRDMSINRIRDLSAIQRMVVDHLKSSLTLMGREPEKVEEYVSLLLQGELDFQDILSTGILVR